MSNSGDLQDKLQVTMFGDFSVVWKGENIIVGTRTADSQFARLMQILLHNREGGVTRTALQSLLFSDSKAEDVHHLLRTDIYNARKRLRQAGLPRGRYIVYSSGRYCWDSSIVVEDDTRQFEELCAGAAAEDDPERKCELLLEACYCYKGEFLPLQTDLLWVAQEGNRYREMFLDCAYQAAEHLKSSFRFQELEDLGRHAAAACPLEELEVLTVEALISMGRLGDAYDYYEETVRYYQSELGSSGTQDIITRVEEIIRGASRPAGLMDEIQTQLEDDEGDGGYFCSYPAFRSIYNMLQRALRRSERSGYLVMFTAERKHEIMSYSEEEMKRISREMQELICSSVRKGDIICRYGSGQYLLMMLSETEEGIRTACERIKSKLEENLPNRTIQYEERIIEEIDG